MEDDRMSGQSDEDDNEEDDDEDDSDDDEEIYTLNDDVPQEKNKESQGKSVFSPKEKEIQKQVNLILNRISEAQMPRCIADAVGLWNKYAAGVVRECFIDAVMNFLLQVIFNII